MKQAKTGQISLVIPNPIYFSYMPLGIGTTLQHGILMFIRKIHSIFTSLSYFVIDLMNLMAKKLQRSVYERADIGVKWKRWK